MIYDPEQQDEMMKELEIAGYDFQPGGHCKAPDGHYIMRNSDMPLWMQVKSVYRTRQGMIQQFGRDMRN